VNRRVVTEKWRSFASEEKKGLTSIWRSPDLRFSKEDTWPLLNGERRSAKKIRRVDAEKLVSPKTDWTGSGSLRLDSQTGHDCAHGQGEQRNRYQDRKRVAERVKRSCYRGRGEKGGFMG